MLTVKVLLLLRLTPGLERRVVPRLYSYMERRRALGVPHDPIEGGVDMVIDFWTERLQEISPELWEKWTAK